MKLTTKGILIILLCVVHSSVSTNRHLLSRNKKAKVVRRYVPDYPRVSAFIQGVASNFIEFNEKCIQEKLVEIRVHENTDWISAFRNSAYGIYDIRCRINDFFKEKLSEWENAFFILWKKEDKIHYYANLYIDSRKNVEHIAFNILTPLQNNQINQKLIQDILTEVDNLWRDIQFFVEVFGKKSKFRDMVKLEQVNEIFSELSEIQAIAPKEQLEYKNSSMWEKLAHTFKVLLKSYDSITSHPDVCLAQSAFGLAKLVKSVISSTFLFVPGLNILTYVWNGFNLLKYIAMAVWDFYSAFQQNNEIDKWTSFGKAFGGILRGLTYLLTGNKKRRFENKRLRNK